MKKLLFCAYLLSALSATSTQASIFDDIGYTKLKTELGVNVPDGAGVKVTHVEASSGGAWIPDVTNAQFVGKTINLLSPNPNGVSGHATSMGLRFYGTISTTSPGISDIDVFETNDWLGAGFLKAGSVTTVSSATRRIANHSWVGDAAGNNVLYLAKLDYVIEVDEFIQVVAMSADPAASHLFSDSFNAIVAGMTQGGGIGTTLVSGAYKADRARPDITAPESVVSAATPRIASAAALLIDYAHSNPALSTDPSVKSTTNVVGNVIYNAERSETIKATLMAGADRATVGNTNPTFDIDPDPAIKTLIPVDITDYRVDIANQTNNGLDKRFGSGQLNIYNSYHILAAGEQNSAEDEQVASGAISNSGFDYDPAFGGQGGSNSTASYYFSTNANPGQKLKADLVWNLEVANPQTTNSEKLYDLDLQLIDVTGGNAIVASSNSGIDNTENIWFDLLSDRSYRLEVIRGSGQTAFNWDYALAWQIVVPGITVVETASATVTEEAGAATDTFTLVLDTQPAGDVLIALTSSDESEATILPTSVTFTSSDWDVPQTIVVTGVDDAVDDGDMSYSISFTVSSVADADYHGFILSSVLASNADDDATFSFIDQAAVGLSTLVTSNAAVVTGVNASLPISISVGEYSLDDGISYTSLDGFVNNNNTVIVRTTSSAVGLTALDVVLTIGGSSDTFTVTTDADTDTDGIFDSVDNCPETANTNQLDTDSDGAGNACDADDDNDGLTDTAEAALNTNPLLADTDSDTVNDNTDNCPVTANTNQLDTDSDGAGNVCDSDDDNDGLTDTAEAALNTNPLLADTDSDTVNDNTDNCPVTANTNQLDTDSDGAGNACDADDDNDGLSDSAEAALNTNPLLADTDSDTVNDNTDNCPVTANTNQLDTDSDGAGNACDADDDNDGLSDLEELFIGTNSLLIDTDSDGENDNVDVFPLDSAEWLDGDNDTVGNNADNCPVIANTDQLDTDNDGAGNVCDSDDDNDGLSDTAEVSLGTNPLLADTDSDSVNDNIDNCPVTVNTDQLDTDSDGAGNVCDSDDDNDGLSDTAEVDLGTNPLLADTDGDLVADNIDAFPTNNAASVDADNDGLPDEWNASCDVTCQTSSGLTLDTANVASSGGGGGGSLGLMWLMWPFLIMLGRRRSLVYLSK